MAVQEHSEERTTKAVLEICPSEQCPLTTTGEDVIDAQMLIANDVCHCEFAVETTGDIAVEHSSQNHSDPCSCHVFAEFDCVPTIVGVEPDGIVVSVYLPGHDVIWELVTALKEVSERVVLRKIIEEQGTTAERTRTVDLETMTDKQRRALELAVEHRYYDQPSEVSLSEIASELDISKQALSQRLATAERRVFTQLFPD
ncbi:helix-turn-helix domain-containing protein [Halapricum hydrolyticum]|uniref:Helix-turn-helix domain-containing protein n=1 Tax=Halapricum hydrolyticum TaxID=2979991 RepID=A0AAE3IB32_9EURY|nr:helix-turn-helix domain-containing protein [Halapricum hydrolyticum]MCU4718282.1 helix-turn-helix domain-containing protein [Halapricum hydrolyticum]MCU4727270.1 helix-turn-helix domain-containing protein [Halapricum hydrolyticum]